MGHTFHALDKLITLSTKRNHSLVQPVSHGAHRGWCEFVVGQRAVVSSTRPANPTALLVYGSGQVSCRTLLFLKNPLWILFTNTVKHLSTVKDCVQCS